MAKRARDLGRLGGEARGQRQGGREAAPEKTRARTEKDLPTPCRGAPRPAEAAGRSRSANREREARRWRTRRTRASRPARGSGDPGPFPPEPPADSPVKSAPRAPKPSSIDNIISEPSLGLRALDTSGGSVPKIELEFVPANRVPCEKKGSEDEREGEQPHADRRAHRAV